MAAWFAKSAEPSGVQPPTLHLDGPRLARSFETLVGASEGEGGVERYITGITFKASLFQETVAPEKLGALTEDTFLGLCAFMATVRRRIGPWLKDNGFETTRRLVAGLLDGAGTDTGDVDKRIAAFCAGFPDGKSYRWVRDLAAELLHYTMPEPYPLMTRWLWDRQANTGVLREIWYDDNVDHITIDIPDGFATFLVLREELTQFLSSNGVFRDMVFYVDLLCAQVYADYIRERGATYLRTDFSSADDPMAYTRRMLGLDGVNPESGRTRVKLAEGATFVPGGPEPRH